MSSSKQPQKVVKNEPSNIFEYSFIQRTQKPTRIVDFNELILPSPVKKTLKEITKENNKKTKKSTITTKFVNFDILLGDVVKPNKEGQKTPFKTFKERVLNGLNKDSTITDLLKNYVNEKSKKSKSVYLDNLKDKMNREGFVIQDINLDKEIEDLDHQINEIEEWEQRWSSIKDDTLKVNSFYTTNFDVLLKNFEESKNYTEESFLKNTEKEKQQTDEKIKQKLHKLVFLRDSVVLNIQSLKSKVEEDEKKLFSLTEKDPSMDTMILLQAITKTK